MTKQPFSRLRLLDRCLRRREAAQLQPALTEAVRTRLPDAPDLAGTCRRFLVRHGLTLAIYDVSIPAGRRQAGEVPAGLILTVLLEGSGHSLVETSGNRLRPVPYRPGTTYLNWAMSAVRGSLRLPARSCFHAVELHASPDFLLAHSLDAVFATLDASHPFAHATSAGLWIGMLPTPERLAATAGRLRVNSASSLHDTLTAEADALDLLLTAIDLLRAPPASAALRQRDLLALRAARDLLRAEPERPWTAASLARCVGLSEKRLRTGFREEFGRSVKPELVAARMDRAYRLLTSEGASVTQAALAVGISNPSHFAAQFQRHFGTMPSALLAKPGRKGRHGRVATNSGPVPARGCGPSADPH